MDERILVSRRRPVASPPPSGLAMRGLGVCSGEPAPPRVDGVAWFTGDCCSDGEGGTC